LLAAGFYDRVHVRPLRNESPQRIPQSPRL
jgi:hypothetical protein